MDSFIFKSAGLGGPGGAAAGAGGAMLAAVAILTPLPFQSRVSVGRGLALFSMGLVHYTLLFSFCSSLLLRYKHLSTAALLDISNKVVSALQAVVATGIGAAVCTHSCPRDLLTTSSVLSDAYAWFGAAYFFYDIWSMYIVHVENAREAALTGGSISSQTVEIDEPEGQDAAGGVRGVATEGVGDQTTLRAFLKHEPLMVAHHIFVGGFGFLVIVYLRKNLGDCVFGFVYLMELSTPCVCIRGALARLGQRSSRLYAANGAAMLATFLLCRLAAPPYAMVLYARSKKLPLPQAMAGLPLGCKLSIMALMLPQYYWFYLMCRGAIKLFLPAKSSSTEIVNKDQENNKTDVNKDQVNKVEVVASLRQVYRASDVIEADKPTVPCCPAADRKLKQS